MTITAAQCREARQQLGWSRVALSVKARVGPDAIHSFEAFERAPGDSARARLRATFEAAGVEFSENSAAIKVNRKGVQRLKITIESEPLCDLTALLKVTLEGKIVGEHLTAIQAQLLVAEIMEHSVLGNKPTATLREGK